MRISVTAKPGAKKAYIKEQEKSLFEKNSSRHFIVAVTAPAAEGKANRAIEDAIALYFHVAPSRVRIVAGQGSRQKTVEIIAR